MGNNQTAVTAGLEELTLKVEVSWKVHKEGVTKMRIEASLTWGLYNSMDFWFPDVSLIRYSLESFIKIPEYVSQSVSVAYSIDDMVYGYLVMDTQKSFPFFF